jgi:ABC-type Fe3+/spermidine/putrescine transport system ATPase subunit
MAELRLDRVTKRYPGFVFDDVSLVFPDRSLTVLLGPSGSGKSTLLRLLAGLEAPDAGRVLLAGRDVTREAAERRGIGLVFQDGALFPHLDVAGNVAFGLRVRGVPRAQRQARVEEALALVGLAALGARRVDRLSGGERQRVALARALAPRPAVLLLDEPLASLDRNLREELRGAIRRLHDELGLTSVLVTHDRDEALALADRLVLLRAGGVVEEGAPRDVFREPRDPFTARFLGAGSLVDGRLVRPDAASVVPDAAGAWRVRAVRFAGFHEEVALERDRDGARLDVRMPVGRAPPAGARVRVDPSP